MSARRIRLLKWRRTYVYLTLFRRSWRPKRWAGGRCTTGPWATYSLPFIGDVTVGWDRTLFGWDDEANR